MCFLIKNKNMIKNLLAFSALIIGINSFAQCPTSSTPIKNCTTGQQIEAFSLNSIAATGNTGCGASGYSSSVQTWSLNVGKTYNFTATTGQTAGFPEAFAIYIDLNGDAQFTSNEMLASNSVTYLHTGSITIPYTGFTIGGPKKMRIVCNASLLTNTMACIGGLSAFGEVEDYNVVLTCPTLTPSIAAPSLLCSAETATLMATNGGNTFLWSPGGATTSSLSIATTATIASTASYTLVTGVTGCTNTASSIVTITVSPSPNTIITGTTTICPAASNTVVLTASGAATYTWNPGSITTNTASFAPSVTTQYTVTSQLGACISNTTVLVTKSSTISPSVASVSVCSSQTNTLIVVGGGDTYSWLPGLQSTSSIVITTTATALGTKNYTVTTGFNGCLSTFVSTTISVNVAPSPTLNVIPSNTLACANNPLTLTVSGATGYLWQNSQTTPTIVVTPTMTTVYSVVGTTGFCTTTKTITIVTQSPTITVSASPSVICSGQSATLTANGGVSYIWNTGTNNAMLINPSVLSTTTYTVYGTDNDGCVSKTVASLIVQACIGVEELESNQTSIYPNPFNNVITISVNDNLVNNSTIEIYDAIGKLVIKENINIAKKAINTNTLIDGIYIYKIQSNGNTTKVGKIIKN